MKTVKSFILSLALFSPLALAYSCDDAIPYCKKMQSCEQAKFYLNQCGIDRLDRDNDGIPCENICGKGGKKAKSSKTKSNDTQQNQEKLTKKAKSRRTS